MTSPVVVSNVLTRAARALGYLGRTEVLSAQDASDALLTFNAMAQSWDIGEKLTAYADTTSILALVPGKQTYTIGPGVGIDLTIPDRPSEIIQAWIRDTSNLDYPVRIVPEFIWNGIGDKGITSQIPDTLFWDTQFPNGFMNIFPVPLLAYSLYFTYAIHVGDITSLTQSLILPDGYERAYVLNLALELMNNGFPCMLDEKSFALLVANAKEAKGNVKRANIKEVIAECDPAIVSRSDATYNIYSDSNPRA